MPNNRVEALRRAQAERGWVATAIVPGPNLFYFTGLGLFMSERPIVALLPTEGDPALVVPFFEAARAEAGWPGTVRIFAYRDEEGHHVAFRQAAAALRLNGQILGVEFLGMRLLERQEIETSSPGVRFEEADGVIAALRMRKDETELAALRAAARINEAAFRAVQAAVRPGVSERELAAEYRLVALRAGANEMAFDPIMASGLNGANPHAEPTDRRLQAGELLTVDAGVRVSRYCSDITRTWAVGPVSDELQAIHELVHRANAAARSATRPGMTAAELDAVARDVIVAAGYGARFPHRLGHGLGLEIHEPPYIIATSSLLLEPGMVFTIEPGVYVPGLGGVRIEDNVVVTRTGCESLTSLPRDK